MTTTSVVVFGAGEAGRRCIASLGSNLCVIGVSDNDAAKHGHYLLGHRIIAPAEILVLEPDQVVIASMYWREIVGQLKNLGVREDAIIVDGKSHDGVAVTGIVVGIQSGAVATLPEWMNPDLRVNLRGEGMHCPLVSVILPTRDRAAVLSRSIDSVLAQTHDNLELLVVDDGSTDGTAGVLANYAGRDARVRIFRQDYAGVSAARNRALAAAAGELIAYIDSDNRWHSEYLDLMVRGFRDPARNTGYAGFNIFDLRTGRFRVVVTPFDFELLQKSNGIDLNVFMHRRVLVGRFGAFNERMTRLVDWELILRYTRQDPPFVIGSALADYYKESGTNRISDDEPFLGNREEMKRSLAALPPARLRGNGPLRVAFVQHEFPAISQTFVQNEIARLIGAGVRVSIFHFRDAFAKADVPSSWDVAKYASREELAWLLTSRGIDLVHTHFAMPHPADFIVPVCDRLNLPFTIKPHAFDIFRNDHHPRHHISQIAAHRLCRSVHCEGEFHRRFLQEAGVPPEKLVVIRNVFEREAFWRPVVQVASRLSRIISISRFVEKKGFHLLIPAFRQLSDQELRLELFGYGEERERLETLAVGDRRISIYDGPRRPEETANLLTNADLFVLPCVEDRHGDTDGLPTVLMEAMASGVLVLTTPIASTPDLVVDGRTGLMVESGSIPALLAGLKRAVGLSLAERVSLVEGAKAHLACGFDPELNIRRLIDVWRGIVPETRPNGSA